MENRNVKDKMIVQRRLRIVDVCNTYRRGFVLLHYNVNMLFVFADAAVVVHIDHIQI